MKAEWDKGFYQLKGVGGNGKVVFRHLKGVGGGNGKVVFCQPESGGMKAKGVIREDDR